MITRPHRPRLHGAGGDAGGCIPAGAQHPGGDLTRPDAAGPHLPGRFPRFLLAVLTFLVLPAARAQEPAILSADAFALGSGRVQLSYGVEHSEKDRETWPDNVPGQPGRPALTKVFPASARVGVSGNVDIIAGWRGRLLTTDAAGTSYRDWGDPSVFTKVTLTDTGLPYAAALLCGFKVPSTRYLPARLGSDAADVYFLSAFSARFAAGEIRAVAGAGIIGDPRFTGSQDDQFTGSVLALWRPLPRGALFAELYGFTGPKEDDDKLQLRGGASADLGPGTLIVYALGRVAGNPSDFSTGFTGSPQWGIGASLTYTFDL